MSMKCREIELLLSSFLDNDLTAAEYDRVNAHLRECPECLRKKERIEEILSRLPDLQEDVPFFLKNRLYNICEGATPARASQRVVYFPKWLAAAIGTVVLFMNLFYFTNIIPPANRQIHALVGTIERFVAQSGGWFDRVKESKDLFFFAFFNKRSMEIKGQEGRSLDPAKTMRKGGENG